jgi:hypothetical protein
LNSESGDGDVSAPLLLMPAQMGICGLSFADVFGKPEGISKSPR